MSAQIANGRLPRKTKPATRLAIGQDSTYRGAERIAEPGDGRHGSGYPFTIGGVCKRDGPADQEGPGPSLSESFHGGKDEYEPDRPVEDAEQHSGHADGNEADAGSDEPHVMGWPGSRNGNGRHRPADGYAGKGIAGDQCRGAVNR